jgi:hypothetical protein
MYARQVDAAGNTSLESSVSWTAAVLQVSSAAALSVGDSQGVAVDTKVTETGFAVSGASTGAGKTVYSWQRCSGSTEASCSNFATSASLTVGKGDVGYRFRLTRTFTSSDGVSVSSTTPLSGVVVPYATGGPVINVPDSLSAPAYGRVLTVTLPTWVGVTSQPAADKLSYAWQLCSTDQAGSCANIAKATTSSYSVLKTDVGKRIRFLVGFTIGTGANTTTAWAPSAISGVITVTGKATVAPSISLGVGKTAPARWVYISVQNGSWLYQTYGSMSYQWQVCSTELPASCTNIPGVTAALQNYKPDNAYVGQRLRAVVTYTGPDGTRASAATAISEPVTK